jgi:carboxypeptidase C (cathepsin A)
MRRSLAGLLATALAMGAAPLPNAAAAWAQAPAAASRSAGGEPGTGKPSGLERPDAAARAASETKISDADIATAPVNEIERTTHHAITVNGQALAYDATAGTLTLRDDEGKPIASMFYVAYVADHGKAGARRPVTFFYNGGPGSSSMWLHMGSLGPMRVHTDSPAATHGAPFTLAPNEHTLLDKTDMVFLDAIGTGFSRPLGETKLSAFWGVDQDLDAFTRGIMRYITKTDRWNSPKYLFGESYGTTRTAGLTYMLQEKGVQLNGAIILSSILNYGIRQPGFDQSYIAYLPSYAAAAWYHNRIPNRPPEIAPFLQQVRDYADGPYAAALAKGQNLSPAEEDAVAQQLASYTGLSVQYLKEANLRVDLQRFRKELLRDQRRTLGRYDSRFTGIDQDATADAPESDPSDTGITGAFVAAFHSYLTDELNFDTKLDYRPTFYQSGTPWDWHHKAPNAHGPQNEPDVALDLSAAMRENPHLQLYSLNGWYDMATPFFQTEYDLSHMELDPSLRPNLHFAYYPSGHMVYLNVEALKALKADVARFYDATESGS